MAMSTRDRQILDFLQAPHFLCQNGGFFVGWHWHFVHFAANRELLAQGVAQ